MFKTSGRIQKSQGDLYLVRSDRCRELEMLVVKILDFLEVVAKSGNTGQLLTKFSKQLHHPAVARLPGGL